MQGVQIVRQTLLRDNLLQRWHYIPPPLDARELAFGLSHQVRVTYSSTMSTLRGSLALIAFPGSYPLPENQRISLVQRIEGPFF